MLAKRKLGQQGLEVSALGLGCMGMSQSYGVPDDQEPIATIHRAIDLGVMLFDTAEVYAPYTNEELLGRSLWTFVREAGVEPTNNNAERLLRRAVMWRRKSFETQSENGSRFVERILTVVTSLRQQGLDVLEYLSSACASLISESGSICLVPDSG
jgi:predicted oxidoreductase